jgi:hypothetical protein
VVSMSSGDGGDGELRAIPWQGPEQQEQQVEVGGYENFDGAEHAYASGAVLFALRAAGLTAKPELEADGAHTDAIALYPDPVRQPKWRVKLRVVPTLMLAVVAVSVAWAVLAALDPLLDLVRS